MNSFTMFFVWACVAVAGIVVVMEMAWKRRTILGLGRDLEVAVRIPIRRIKIAILVSTIAFTVSLLTACGVNIIMMLNGSMKAEGKTFLALVLSPVLVYVYYELLLLLVDWTAYVRKLILNDEIERKERELF